jgi:hypothetical protein
MCLRESCMRENRTCSFGGRRRPARKRASYDPADRVAEPSCWKIALLFFDRLRSMNTLLSPSENSRRPAPEHMPIECGVFVSSDAEARKCKKLRHVVQT